MVNSLEQLWKPITSSETIEGGVEAAKAVFELAKTLNEQKDKNPQIKHLVEKIPTLLEVLNSPGGQIVNALFPFVPLATGLIRFIFDVTKEEPSTGQIVAIVTQAAYIESVRATLAMNPVFIHDESITKDEVQKKIKKLGVIEINDEEAKQTLVSFRDSKLALAFNEVLLARLKETRISQFEIDAWVKRVSSNTPRYIHQILARSGDSVKELTTWYSIGGKNEFEKYLSIETYLNEKIKPLPDEKVFNEDFNFKDIYIPLKAVLLDENGKRVNNNNAFFLDEWVKKTISDINKQDRVIFVEAGPGRGKTVFCRMFADWTMQKLHPRLTPIYIRLRDIDNFEQSFSRILSDVLSHCDFVSNDGGWLTDRNTQYLFLLDGLDELHIEGRSKGGIQRFVDQVGRFQEDFKGKETGHRVILTGRSLALQGIDLKDNFQKVELLPMDDDLQNEWLEKWQKVVFTNKPNASHEETNRFREFLKTDNCPKEIKNDIAREPLLLFMLAQLHKHKKISESDFQQTIDGTQAKILIYQKSLEWVLTKQRKKLNYVLTGLRNDGLERILFEAGFCVMTV